MLFVSSMAVVAIDYFVANVTYNENAGLPQKHTNDLNGHRTVYRNDGKLSIVECLHILMVFSLFVASFIRMVVNTVGKDDEKFDYGLAGNNCKMFELETFEQFQLYDILFLINSLLPVVLIIFLWVSGRFSCLYYVLETNVYVCKKSKTQI